ncbi:MAG: hypothetical protein HQL16_04645 [Candidatus Omnitrophica bacterium]|nr:hypothetical protein [Candidatus Omnitrophota bacterium]
MDKRARVSLKDIDEDRLYALLSYVSLLCVFPLIQKKGNEFVQSHARQGLALFLSEFVIFILSILFPQVMAPFLFIFGVLAFWGMIKSLKGEKVEIPFIYPLSQKLVL